MHTLTIRWRVALSRKQADSIISIHSWNFDLKNSYEFLTTSRLAVDRYTHVTKYFNYVQYELVYHKASEGQCTSVINRGVSDEN
jgi:hypothetical protein